MAPVPLPPWAPGARRARDDVGAGRYEAHRPSSRSGWQDMVDTHRIASHAGFRHEDP